LLENTLGTCFRKDYNQYVDFDVLQHVNVFWSIIIYYQLFQSSYFL